MNRFENKIVLVTGAANGIGRGMVEKLMSEGAKLAALDIEGDTLKEVFGGNENVLCITCDVRDYKAVQETVKQVLEHYGRIDILMNNAGIVHRTSIRECSLEDWVDTINTNLNGSFFVAQAVANSMVERGIAGVIVNTASNAVRDTGVNTGAYGPSKAGVANLTKVMALEYAPYGIRINAFGPGATKTRMIAGTLNDPERNKRFLTKFPLGRYGEIREAVDTALFLASDASSFITGEILFEDGGFCL